MTPTKTLYRLAEAAALAMTLALAAPALAQTVDTPNAATPGTALPSTGNCSDFSGSGTCNGNQETSGAVTEPDMPTDSGAVGPITPDISGGEIGAPTTTGTTGTSAAGTLQ